MDVQRERMGDAALAALQSLVLPFHSLVVPALGSVRCPCAPALVLCFLLSYINSDSILYLQTEFCIRFTHHSYIYSFVLHEVIDSLKIEASSL